MDRLENLDTCLHYLMEQNHVQTEIPTTLDEEQRLLRALMNIWEPQPLSNEYLTAQDRELQQQRDEKGIVDPDGTGVLLWQGDITRLRVDAIVNAANSRMLGCWHPLHSCIDNAIHSAAGLQLRAECEQLMQGTLLPTGEARITQAYNLPCRHVIHTVGPIVPTGIPTAEQEEQLADCYRNCLALAEGYGCHSLAFCCISTGEFRFPNHRAAEIAIGTVAAAHTTMTVIFNVFKDTDYDIYRQILAARR